ncbi:CBS domain-containing protein, partial [Escherichia coli]|nr:CBS domain-containing protein [Escherichia coli]
DRNRSHWSTSKTPSYTKSVSWQHHPQQQGLDAALIDAPLAVDAQTPLSELLSHVGQAPCAVPVVDEDQQYVGIISKGMLLRALDREGVNNG